MFSEINKSGSLAEAAQSLGVALPKASRLLSRLEKDLGFKLLDRTKKPSVFTPSALEILPQVNSLLNEWRRLLDLSDSLSKEPRTQKRKVLRVSLPINMDRSSFYAALSEMMKNFPDISLEISSDIGQEGLLSGRADVAWFGYKPTVEGILAIPAFTNLSFLMASPTYLRNNGEPKNIRDLINHTLILRETKNESFSQKLEYKNLRYEIDERHKRLLGDSEACKKLLLSGKGIAVDMNPTFVEKELLSGELIPVLPGWHRTPWFIHICCRNASSSDPLIRKTIEVIRHTALNNEHFNWLFWYQKLGLPIEAINSENL